MIPHVIKAKWTAYKIKEKFIRLKETKIISFRSYFFHWGNMYSWLSCDHVAVSYRDWHQGFSGEHFKVFYVLISLPRKGLSEFRDSKSLKLLCKRIMEELLSSQSNQLTINDSKKKTIQTWKNSNTQNWQVFTKQIALWKNN